MQNTVTITRPEFLSLLTAEIEHRDWVLTADEFDVLWTGDDAWITAQGAGGNRWAQLLGEFSQEDFQGAETAEELAEVIGGACYNALMAGDSEE